MANHSRYQERVIKNYYKNRDAISLQRVQELVTELYLSEGKKREKHWQSIVGHLQKLEIKQARIDQLRKLDDPANVATLIQELMGK